MEKRYLYVVLTRTNTLISHLIQFFKGDAYTHASIALDKDLGQMYSFARRDTYNPFLGRFKKEDLNAGIYRFCDTLPGAVIEMEVTGEQYDRAKALLDQFILHGDRYRYHYKGLWYSLLDKPTHREDRFLCSAFVAHILKESGIADLGRPGNLVRPQHLRDLEGKLLYEGDLKRRAIRQDAGNRDSGVRDKVWDMAAGREILLRTSYRT